MPNTDMVRITSFCGARCRTQAQHKTGHPSAFYTRYYPAPLGNRSLALKARNNAIFPYFNPLLLTIMINEFSLITAR